MIVIMSAFALYGERRSGAPRRLALRLCRKILGDGEAIGEVPPPPPPPGRSWHLWHTAVPSAHLHVCASMSDTHFSCFTNFGHKSCGCCCDCAAPSFLRLRGESGCESAAAAG